MVYMDDVEERSALCQKLQTWMELSCASLPVQIVHDTPQERPFILFWDLDSHLSPPNLASDWDCALFLCSSDPQKAIDSYLFHPTGFLQKPISMDKLWNALLRCAPLWWTSLERLEVMSARVRMQLPYYHLIWAEGTRRGCLLHTTCQSISTREPLYQLEQRLPETVFLRCQRSFVINLCHVHQVTNSSVILSDGTELSLGRGNKSDLLNTYRRFCLLRYGDARKG